MEAAEFSERDKRTYLLLYIFKGSTLLLKIPSGGGRPLASHPPIDRHSPAYDKNVRD